MFCCAPYLWKLGRFVRKPRGPISVTHSGQARATCIFLFFSFEVNYIPRSLCLNGAFLLAVVLRGHTDLLFMVPLELWNFISRMRNATSEIIHCGHFKFNRLFDTLDKVV